MASLSSIPACLVRNRGITWSTASVAADGPSTMSTPWSSPTRIPTTSAGRCDSTTRRVPRSSRTSRFAPCSTPPSWTIRRIPPHSTSTRPTIGPRRWSASSPSRRRGEGVAPGRQQSSSNGSAMPARRPDRCWPSRGRHARWSTGRRSSSLDANGWRCTRRATPTTISVSTTPSSVSCSRATTCSRRSRPTSAGWPRTTIRSPSSSRRCNEWPR